MLLHLVRASRGAAHTICAVNGDEGSGSHNIWLPVGIGLSMDIETKVVQHVSSPKESNLRYQAQIVTCVDIFLIITTL